MSAVQTSMTIHFLGGGNMATAIIQGLSRSAPDIKLVIADPSEAVRARHQASGLETHADIEECEHVQCIVLAVKPQYFPDTIKSLSQALHPNALIVSVMAGISTKTIESSFPDSRVIRTMPNTPMAVAQGMVGLARGQKATAQDMLPAELLPLRVACASQYLRLCAPGAWCGHQRRRDEGAHAAR